jgi:hypothetical protein
MAKTHIVGTITGVFDGTLDGLAARLLRRTRVGYTVELLESKPPFHKGDTLHLSPAEFRWCFKRGYRWKQHHIDQSHRSRHLHF